MHLDAAAPRSLPPVHSPADRRCQALLALTASSKDAVNATIEKGAAAGDCADPDPLQELGFMYNRHIEDPDGNVRESIWMNPAAMQ
jgi:predicted lactoylglutathione lyase